MKLRLFVSNKTVLLVEAVVILHEAEVDHIQEADPLRGSPAHALAAHVDLIHQRNPSPLHDHPRGGGHPLQGVLNLVLVHRHSYSFFSVMYYFSFFALESERTIMN